MMASSVATLDRGEHWVILEPRYSGDVPNSLHGKVQESRERTSENVPDDI